MLRAACETSARRALPFARICPNGRRGTGRSDLRQSALHFAPNHERLLAKLMSFSPGGSGGANAQCVAGCGPCPDCAWSRWNGPWAVKNCAGRQSRALIGSLDDYYAWTSPYARMVYLWQTTYVHPLDGSEAIVPIGFTGSALLPFLEKLGRAGAPRLLAHIGVNWKNGPICRSPTQGCCCSSAPVSSVAQR